jgi:hypothetical protein
MIMSGEDIRARKKAVMKGHSHKGRVVPILFFNRAPRR